MADKSPRTIKVRLTSSPFMGDPTGAEAYYTALGRALVLWGRAESHFGYLLDCVCTAPPARHLRPADMPPTLKQKAKLFRFILKRVPEFGHLKEPLRKIVTDLMNAAQDRHVIIHGHWNGTTRRKALSSRPAIEAENLSARDMLCRWLI